MATKKSAATKPKKAGTAVARTTSFAAGKRASVATKPGYSACIVLLPVDVGPKGGIVFQVGLRIGPSAGKVSFVPRGKETLVIDSPKSSLSTTALNDVVRKAWARKGGPPTSVVD